MCTFKTSFFKVTSEVCFVLCVCCLFGPKISVFIFMIKLSTLEKHRYRYTTDYFWSQRKSSQAISGDLFIVSGSRTRSRLLLDRIFDHFCCCLLCTVLCESSFMQKMWLVPVKWYFRESELKS